VPRFIWARDRQPAAKGASPETTARRHFARFAAAYGVEGDAIDHMGVTSVGKLRGGSYLARLQQEVDGVEVYRSEVKVVMRPDLSLVALSGTPSQATGVRQEDGRFLLSAEDALGTALGHLYGAPLSTRIVAVDHRDGAVWLVLELPSPVRLSRPARARRVFYPVEERLVPAYLVEFFSGRAELASSDAFRYLVAADDGRILERHDLVRRDSFDYRVYAEATGDRRPLDGPIGDFTPHPTGAPDGSDPPFVAPQLVSMESFKRLPEGAVDPWLPPAPPRPAATTSMPTPTASSSTGSRPATSGRRPPRPAASITPSTSARSPTLPTPR
jgi:hypothetical protein